jgi:hypothetical protein
MKPMISLAKKLGFKSGQAICLLNSTAEVQTLLQQEYPTQVRIFDTLGHQLYDIIMFWPAQHDELSDRFTKLQRSIVFNGAIWVVIPKKKFAQNRGIYFKWSDIQKAALLTDLVDNKVVSLTNEEYATRFVIRNNRRGEHI